MSSLTWEACWEPRLSRSEPKLGSKSSMAADNVPQLKKVRMVSPLQVIASHPWCYYPLTHTGAHTMMLHTTFPWLSCMAGSFLTESGAVCLGKSSAPTAQKVRNITSIYISASRPLLSLSLSYSLSLSLQCLTHDM